MLLHQHGDGALACLLDIAKAYPSMPDAYLVHGLRSIGAPANVYDMVESIHTHNTGVYGNVKGGGLLESRPPPPPSRPPKVLERGFLQIDILGEAVGAAGARKFFFSPPEGEIFFFTLCAYTQNTQDFV